MSEVKILPNLVWKYNYEPGFDVQAFLDYQSKKQSYIKQKQMEASQLPAIQILLTNGSAIENL